MTYGKESDAMRECRESYIRDRAAERRVVFYQTQALQELREACADLARLDDADLDARIEAVDTWLDRYQCARPDWEEPSE